MSLSGPAGAQTWTRLNISGEIWKWLCTDARHPTCWSLRGPAKKNGRNWPKIGVPSNIFVQIFSEPFLLCHCRVLCVEFWGKKGNLIPFGNIAASSNGVAKPVRWPRRNFRHPQKRFQSTRSKFGANPSKMCWDTTQLSVWRLCCRFWLAVPDKRFRKI